MATPTKATRISNSKKLLIEEGYEIIDKDTRLCCSCGEYKRYTPLKPNGNMFYASMASINKGIGIIPVCKTCIEKLFIENSIKTKNDQKLAMYLLCQELNVYWNEGVWEMAEKSKNKSYGMYFQKVNSLPQYKDMNFTDSEDYMGDINDTIAINNQRVESKKYSDKWMCECSKSELKYLDEYFQKLKEDFNIVTANHLDYAKKITRASFLMDKEFEKIMDGSGSDASYTKYKQIYDDLCKSAQFAESGRGKTAVGNGISEIVESVENKKWIYSKENFEKDEMDLLLDQFSNIMKSVR